MRSDQRWRRRAGILLLLSLTICGLVAAAHAQVPLLPGGARLQFIPDPPAAVIRPRLLASYGALVAAALLSILYVFRGRAFIVYWILSWLLVAGSLFLVSRGYRDVMLGGVMLGCSQLLSAWSAGLLLLAARAFPEAPLRWSVPVKVAAATAVWFLTAPLLGGLHAVLVTGPAITAFILAWAGLLHFHLFRRTRYSGTALIGAGLVALAAADVASAAAVIGTATSGELANRILGFNVVTNIFIALGMHLLVFEDMTDELRRTNRDLAAANEEVRRLAITDSLTGCLLGGLLVVMERHEMQRHHRYGTPLSVMFVDVNRFKKLNDMLGHDTGDAVLRSIGQLLRVQVRESDYVIRWGGDEFLVLMNCTLSQARRKTAELKAAFHSEPETAHLPGDVGLSVGVSEVSTDADDLPDAIRLADERMYQDKFAERARGGQAGREVVHTDVGEIFTGSSRSSGR